MDNLPERPLDQPEPKRDHSLSKDEWVHEYTRAFNSLIKGPDGVAYLCESISEAEDSAIDQLRKAVLSEDAEKAGNLYLRMIDAYVGRVALRETKEKHGECDCEQVCESAS